MLFDGKSAVLWLDVDNLGGVFFKNAPVVSKSWNLIHTLLRLPGRGMNQLRNFKTWKYHSKPNYLIRLSVFPCSEKQLSRQTCAIHNTQLLGITLEFSKSRRNWDQTILCPMAVKLHTAGSAFLLQSTHLTLEQKVLLIVNVLPGLECWSIFLIIYGIFCEVNHSEPLVQICWIYAEYTFCWPYLGHCFSLVILQGLSQKILRVSSPAILGSPRGGSNACLTCPGPGSKS